MHRLNGPVISGPFLFFLLCFSTGTLAADHHHQSPGREGSLQPLRVRIESKHRVSLSETVVDTLSLWLDAADIQIAGFSLKIASGNPDLEILGAIPGELLESCQWELFSASPIATASGDPAQVWRISGLAKASADTIQANCLSSPGRSSIARLILALSASEAVGPLPLFFYWQDCRDNVLSDSSGDHLYLSQKVLDYVPINWQPTGRALFPNRTGAPPTCASPRARNAPRRMIEFSNGGYDRSGESGSDDRNK